MMMHMQQSLARGGAYRFDLCGDTLVRYCQPVG